MKNIVLIGMPGAGKSTIGVILAKRLLMDFIDTDVLTQQRLKRGLQEILNEQGYLALRELEEKEIVALTVTSAVIATGGSAAYSEKAMRHLKAHGAVYYLKVEIKTLLSRINNMETRGIAKSKEQTFEDLYTEREVLYRKYADHEIDCGNKSHETIAEEIAGKLCRER